VSIQFCGFTCEKERILYRQRQCGSFLEGADSNIAVSSARERVAVPVMEVYGFKPLL
jgi:hypothetical protein